MENSDLNNFDYAAWQAQFAQRFFDTLAQRLPQVTQHQSVIVERIRQRLEDSAHLISDEAAIGHLELSALVLETYRALEGSVPQNELIAHLQWALIEPDRAVILEGTRAALDASPDPLETLAALSKDRETSYFGSSFAFEHLQDDGHAHLTNIRRCVWRSFFQEQNAPQLTPIFCAFDHNWIEAISPERHGVNFQRPTTLGWGGDACRFWFIRKAVKSRSRVGTAHPTG